MTVRQIIQEIETLPTTEQQEIVREVQSRLTANSSGTTIRFISKEEAMRVSASIFEEYNDLFRKLAQ